MQNCVAVQHDNSKKAGQNAPQGCNRSKNANNGSQCCIVTSTGIVKYEGELAVDALEMFPAFGLNRYYVMSVDELRVIYLTK